MPRDSTVGWQVHKLLSMNQSNLFSLLSLREVIVLFKIVDWFVFLFIFLCFLGNQRSVKLGGNAVSSLVLFLFVFIK